MVSLYLAYRGGTFDNLPGGPDKGLSKEEFSRKAIEAIARWDDAIILEAGKPVGLAVVHLLGLHGLVNIFWFPWASPRNKLETTLKFILDHKRHIHLMAASGEKRFFDHLYRYGVVRGIGVSMRWDDNPVTLYEAT